MKKILLLVICLLCFTILFETQAQVQNSCNVCGDRPFCTSTKNSFRFDYLGAQELNNGNTLLKFRVFNLSPFPLEYVSFELPDKQTPAFAPASSYISKYHYSVQNHYNDSLIKFTGLNTANFRYDQSDKFFYQVNTTLFQKYWDKNIRIEARAGETTSIINLDLEGCFSSRIIPLPVELISIKGIASDQEITIKWTTASEQNNDRFEIQHSRNASAFETVGSVAGSGTTSSSKNYQFKHSTPFLGKNYYRLKQIDLDGSYQFSPIILVEAPDIRSSVDFQVYPNPVINKELFIKWNKVDASIRSISVSLIDLEGKVLFKQQYFPESQLRIEFNNKNLNPGFYLIKIETIQDSSINKILVLP